MNRTGNEQTISAKSVPVLTPVRKPQSAPTPEQFEVAVMWLESNEGDEGERDACLAVADWIKHQAFDKMLRSEARAAGVTVANLRRKLSERYP